MLIYNTLLILGIVLGLPVILISLLVSDKRRKTFLKRLMPGADVAAFHKTGRKGDHKQTVWVHALSVGEALSAVPLVYGLKQRHPEIRIVFSVATLTGYAVAQNELAHLVSALFFSPYDLPFLAARLQAKLNPALAVIVETDIWPNFLYQMNRKRVPVILVNARLSKRSFAGYRRLAVFFKPLFSCFTCICAQSEADARRFETLTATPARVKITGNVKFNQTGTSVSAEEIEAMRALLKAPPGRTILLAGSTHKGEEAFLLEALLKFKTSASAPFLVLVPRDHRRAKGVCRLAQEFGFACGLISHMQNDALSGGEAVAVVGAMGVLRRLYAVADIAFVGGSLVDCGGHNPLEPAAFAKPILFGPDMSDFADMAHLLKTAGGAMEIADSEELAAAIQTLIKAPHKATAMGKNARRVFDQTPGGLEKTLDEIGRVLRSSEAR